MYAEDVQPVLRCPQCNKPFDKTSTLKRHGYYCRSRRLGSTSRARSCLSCAKAKVRCDGKRSKCSRCQTKDIECHYPAKTSINSEQRNQHNEDAQTRRWKPSPSDSAVDVDYQRPSEDDETNSDSTLDVADLDFSSLLGADDPTIDFNDLWNPPKDAGTFGSPLAEPLFLNHGSSTPFDQGIHVQQTWPFLSAEIPRHPTQALVRSLEPRPKMDRGTQRIAKLIFHTLKSYPVMMMRHNTLPPFIHPHSLSINAGSDQIEPLTNCINLVQMIGMGFQGGRKLFWRNVRSECERLSAEYLTLDKWELLTALQALSIYILIRLDEGETEYNNLDFLMLKTVTIISKQLAFRTSQTHAVLRNYASEVSWRDWIFEESRRRICIIYQVVNMLVYFGPASMCDDQLKLVLAPLPANNRLWEANNEFAWKTESETENGMRPAFGLADDGELVELDENQLHCHEPVLLYKPLDVNGSSRRTASWEEWCSGMDGLGSLVMLAASLIA